MVRLWERVWNFVKEGLVLLGGVRGSASCGLGGDGEEEGRGEVECVGRVATRLL